MAASHSTLVFSELDDFHPDRLFQRSQLFLRLREVRRRLQDPDTFAAAAEELGIPVGPQAVRKPAAEAASAKAVAAQLVQQHPGGLLDEMVESFGRRFPVRAGRFARATHCRTSYAR